MGAEPRVRKSALRMRGGIVEVVVIARVAILKLSSEIAEQTSSLLNLKQIYCVNPTQAILALVLYRG